MSMLITFVQATGWLSFSIFFNILNTIVYSTLFPKYLNSLTENETSFSIGSSIMNTLTTLLSALVLPFLGSFTDQLNITKHSLILTSFLGWIVTIFLIFIVLPLQKLNLPFIPMLAAEFIFIVAMFLLRISVMNNNALLTCFQFKSRSILSILGNCLGFTVNLLGLGFIRLWKDEWTNKLIETFPFLNIISIEGYWIILSTIIAGIGGVWMIFSPSGISKINNLYSTFNSSTITIDPTIKNEVSIYASTNIKRTSIEKKSKTQSIDTNPPYDSIDTQTTPLSKSWKNSSYGSHISKDKEPQSYYNNTNDIIENSIITEPEEDQSDSDIIEPDFIKQKSSDSSSSSIINRLNRLKSAFIQSFLRIIDTIRRWRSNSEYFHSWLFLFSYVFIAAPGVVFTVIFTFMFLAVFPHLKENVHGSVDLNLFYKVFMVVGVFFALFFDKIMNYIFKSSKYLDIFILIFHTIVFQILMLLVFLLITFKFNYQFVLWTSMFVGFIYSWNTSVTRGLMSKLIPIEKKGEFMGFYSTFTYIGITFVSALDAILKALGAPSHIMLLLLFFWPIPGYIFMFILFVSLNRQSKNELETTIVLEDEALESRND